MGRDLRQAGPAAALNAALQDPARHNGLERALVAPLANAQQARRTACAAEAAATAAQFFTMAAMRS